MNSGRSVGGQLTKLTGAELFAVAAIFLALLGFGRALLELVDRWYQQEEYSHGFLVPVVTLWLLWMRRAALRANIGQPSWYGLALIVLACVMNIMGELSAIFFFSQVGFVVALMGIVLSIGGYSLLRLAFVPIAFLLFAIPLPNIVNRALTLRLQLLSSSLGVFYIGIFGVPVFLDGNIIDLGNYKLLVAEACSGLRYLYPLLSLGFLAAYFFRAQMWQRVLVFLSSIPIAIGMNGLRIGLVAVLVERWGTEVAEGTLHFFEGWVIFLACAGLLLIEMYLLAKISGKGLFDVCYIGEISATLPRGLQAKSVNKFPLAACVFVLLIGGLVIFSVSGRTEAVPERTRLVEFPTQIGEWQGHTSLLDVETERWLRSDDYLLSDYRLSNGEMVNLHVAYYASQRNAVSPHSPSDCIPGGGWQIIDRQEGIYNNHGEALPFNRVTIEKGAVRQLVYYWFDEQGRRIANEYWAKFYRSADSVMENRTDGALVRLVTQMKSSESRRGRRPTPASFHATCAAAPDAVPAIIERGQYGQPADCAIFA